MTNEITERESTKERERKRLRTDSVVVCAVHVPGHAKVSDLDQQVFPDQAVPGGQVSVDKVLRGQVNHASSNLLGNVQHLGLCELHQDAVLTVCHEYCVGTVGPATTSTISSTQDNF